MTSLQKDSARFVETVIDGETVVMSLSDGSFYSLSGSAGRTWQLLDNPTSLASIIDTLSDEYGVAPSAIADDVDAFIVQLRSAGLLAQG